MFDGFIKYWKGVGLVLDGQICVETGAQIKFEVNLNEKFDSKKPSTIKQENVEQL